jgi:deazaflavin-dependent oxidoreductase (nitroreductase family)
MASNLPERTRREPLAAQLYVIPRTIKPVQDALVRLLRRYFERAPGWVLLTTRGRKSGLAREILLPCERTRDALILISTYGHRSNWLRNIESDPHVTVTCGGWVIRGRAEIVEDVQRKRAIVTAAPFYPAAPFAVVHAVLKTVLRPLLVLSLRAWVTHRPVVLVRPQGGVVAEPGSPPP